MSVILPPFGAPEAIRRESEADLQAEKVAADRLAQCFEWEMVKLCPSKYIVDFAAFHRGSLVAYVEIKTRNISHDQLASFQTFMVSANKIAWLKMMAWSGGKNVMALMVASLTDALLMANVRTMNLHHQYGGRKDREEWRDMEPIAHIPFSSMQLIP